MIFQETKDNGFVKLRRNLLCHLEDGRLSMNEFAVYVAMIILAESDTGELKTCGRALHTLFHPGKNLSERGMRDVIARLEEGGYLSRNLRNGQHGVHPVLLNKYPITTGPNAGHMASGSPKNAPKKVQKTGELICEAMWKGSSQVLSKVAGEDQPHLSEPGAGEEPETVSTTKSEGWDDSELTSGEPAQRGFGADEGSLTCKVPGLLTGQLSHQVSPTIQEGDTESERYTEALKASTKSEEQTEKDPKSSGGGSGILNPVKVGEVEGEERSSGEAPGKAKAEEEASSSGKVLDPVTPEEALVQDMWTRLKSLPHFGRVQKQWTVTFRNLLREYTTETLHGAIAYAFDHKYWSRQLFRDDLDPVACFCEHLEEFTLKWASAQHQEELANSPVKLPPVTYLPSDEPVELPGGGIPGLQTATREENRQRSLKILAEQERNKPSAEEIARLQAEADAQTLRRKAIVQFLNEDHAAQQALEQQALQQQALQAKKVTP
jgi:hypothetical protein